MTCLDQHPPLPDALQCSRDLLDSVPAENLHPQSPLSFPATTWPPLPLYSLAQPSPVFSGFHAWPPAEAVLHTATVCWEATDFFLAPF